MTEHLLRRACDRCHNQKLRCERDGDICTRCARAGAECMWSVSRRKPPARLGSLSPTEYTQPPTGSKRKRLMTPSLPQSTVSTLEKHLMNDPGSHGQYDFQKRSAPGPMVYDRRPDHQENYSNFRYGGMMAQNPSVNNPNPFQPLTEAADFWTNVPQSINWAPSYVSTGENSAVVTTAVNPGIFSTVGLNQHPAAMLPRSGSMPTPRSGSMPTPRSPGLNMTPETPQLQFPPLMVSTSMPQSPVNVVQSLSTLNVQLHDNAARIRAQRTQISGKHTSKEDPRSRSASVATGGPSEFAGSFEEDLAIDETFQLALDFVDTLSGQGSRLDAFSSPHSRARGSSTSLISPSSTSNQPSNIPAEFPELSQPTVESSSLPVPRFEDQAAVLLVLSCYLRMINTFDEIFEHIQTVLEQSGPNDSLGNLRLKRISVGNFSPPKDSLAHANLVLKMSEDLLTCVRGKVKDASGAEDHDNDAAILEGKVMQSAQAMNEETPNDVTKMTLLAIKVREVKIVNKLRRMRASLHQNSIFV